MNENDKIDFAALDPSQNQPRWERLIALTIKNALMRRKKSVSSQLRTWARPTFALAAALALVVWVGAFWVGSQHPDNTDPACQLLQWATNNETPSLTKTLEVLGGSNGQR